MKVNRCPECGREPRHFTPKEAGDDEGYHYYACPDSPARCEHESSWGKTKAAAARSWNRDNPATAVTVRERSAP